MNGKIVKHFSRMFASRVINIISEMFISIIIIRYLGPEQKGLMVEVQAIASFLWFVATVGWGDILIKEYAENASRTKEIAVIAIIIMLIDVEFLLVLWEYYPY